ncbi:MAG: hypothetical protein KDK53_17600 [Maritimibacter sp.]|nr:hypothetical protein [Maritimibacter sp.]
MVASISTCVFLSQGLDVFGVEDPFVPASLVCNDVRSERPNELFQGALADTERLGGAGKVERFDGPRRAGNELEMLVSSGHPRGNCSVGKIAERISTFSWSFLRPAREVLEIARNSSAEVVRWPGPQPPLSVAFLHRSYLGSVAGAPNQCFTGAYPGETRGVSGEHYSRREVQTCQW